MAIRGSVVSRQRVCKYCGDLHELARWPDNCKDNPWPRSDHPAPYVVSDNLPGGVNGLYHHGVAHKIDSKAAYRRATKESGCIEVGNEFDAADMSQRAYVAPDENAIQSGINEALARHGIESDDDLKKVDYGLG